MKRIRLAHSFSLARLWRTGAALPKQLFPWVVAMLPLLGTGCAQLFPSLGLSSLSVRVARASDGDLVKETLHQAVATLPPPNGPDHVAPPTTIRSLAINFDTVLRL